MTERRDVAAYAGGVFSAGGDGVAHEEPLEIRLNGAVVAMTMRSPGDDAVLARGFLHAEGLVDGRAAMAIHGEGNRVDVEAAGAAAPAAPVRIGYVGASCGVCGRAAIDDMVARLAPVPASGWGIATPELLALPDRLRAYQPGFAQSGAVHAAALFDAHGAILAGYEDVGRHNAVDKLIGRMLADGLTGGLLVSGRTSFEIIQKAAMAGIPLVAAISGPTSMAVDLSLAMGITLVGFLRPGRFNVYGHPGRVRG